MGKDLTYSEEVYIAGIKSNNEKVLSAFYRSHYGMIANFIANNQGTEQEAKDIYQEAVIVVFEKLRTEDFQLNCKVGTYLYSICRRLWLKKLYEKKRFLGKIEEHEQFIDIAQEMPQAEENEKKFAHMAAALQQLGEPCRSLIEDYYINKASMQDITEKFGYTNADNAKNQKYKCLQRLKKLFFTNYNTIVN